MSIVMPRSGCDEIAVSKDMSPTVLVIQIRSCAKTITAVQPTNEVHGYKRPMANITDSQDKLPNGARMK